MRMAVSNPNTCIRVDIERLLKEYEEMALNEGLDGDAFRGNLINDYLEQLAKNEIDYYFGLLYADAYQALDYIKRYDNDLDEDEKKLLDVLININSIDELINEIVINPNLGLSLLDAEEEFRFQIEGDWNKRDFFSETKTLMPKIKKVFPHVLYDLVETFYPYNLDELDMYYDHLNENMCQTNANFQFNNEVYEIFKMLNMTDKDNYRDLLANMFHYYYRYMKYANKSLDHFDIEPIEFELICSYESKEDIADLCAEDERFLREIIRGYIDYKKDVSNHDKIKEYFNKK